MLPEHKPAHGGHWRGAKCWSQTGWECPALRPVPLQLPGPPWSRRHGWHSSARRDTNAENLRLMRGAGVLPPTWALTVSGVHQLMHLSPASKPAPLLLMLNRTSGSSATRTPNWGRLAACSHRLPRPGSLHGANPRQGCSRVPIFPLALLTQAAPTRGLSPSRPERGAAIGRMLNSP